MRSKLFPNLSTETLHAVLQNNARIDGADDISLETAEKLRQLDLVEVSIYEYSRCVNSDDPDYHRLNYEQRECNGEIDINQDICPICGRQIDDQNSKQKFTSVFISLQYSKFVEYIEYALNSIKVVKSLQRIGENSFSVQFNNGRLLKVVILTPDTDMRERYSGINFGGAHLIVYIAPYEKPLTNLLNEHKVIWVGDFLCQNENTIGEMLFAATTSNEIISRATLENVERQFDDYINKISWQVFEQDFVPRLIGRITQNATVIETYLNDLQTLNNTILGVFPINIGGAGETDIRFINKYEIMSTFFSSNNIIDAKRYSITTTITADHVRDVLVHLNQISDPKPISAIILTSTEKIESAAWALTCRFRDTHHYWQIVLLPKFLVLELISVFNAHDLIK